MVWLQKIQKKPKKLLFQLKLEEEVRLRKEMEDKYLLEIAQLRAALSISNDFKMISNKHYKTYLKTYDEWNNRGAIIQNIMKIESDSGVELLKWDEDQIQMFLDRTNSVILQNISATILHNKIA